MSTRPRLAVLLLLALSILGVLASGCSKIATPKGWASPVLSDGQLVLAHRKDLYAFDGATLAPQWKFSGTKGSDIVALYGTPAVDGGSVFLPAYSGKLYALNGKTGAPLWAAPFKTSGPLVGGVTVANGTVYFGSSDGKLYALDATTGVLKWPPFKTGKDIWSTPVVIGEDLYVTSLDGHLYVLDPATGKERWEFKTDAGVAATPVIDQASGRVYIGGLDARLRAIDLQTHEQIWEIKAGNWFWSRPLLDSGIVFAASVDHKVYAVTAATGEQQWDKPFTTSDVVLAAPIAVGDVVFIADRKGNVYALNKQTGQPAFAKPLALGSSVLADPILIQTNSSNAIAVLTTGGHLFLIDPSTLKVVRDVPLVGS